MLATLVRGRARRLHDLENVMVQTSIRPSCPAPKAPPPRPRPQCPPRLQYYSSERTYSDNKDGRSLLPIHS